MGKERMPRIQQSMINFGKAIDDFSDLAIPKIYDLGERASRKMEEIGVQVKISGLVIAFRLTEGVAALGQLFGLHLKYGKIENEIVSRVSSFIESELDKRGRKMKQEEISQYGRWITVTAIGQLLCEANRERNNQTAISLRLIAERVLKEGAEISRRFEEGNLEEIDPSWLRKLGQKITNPQTPIPELQNQFDIFVNNPVRTISRNNDL